MVDPIRSNSTQPVKPIQSQNQSQTRCTENGWSGQNFADVLANVENLRFSNHAQKRLQYRNITIDQDGMSRLAGAVDKAEKRGGKESLVLVDNLAFIVNVKERLVVTALDEQSRGEGVFTQIDSVVFADPSQNQKSADNTVNNNIINSHFHRLALLEEACDVPIQESNIMIRSMFTAISSLNLHQTYLDVIADNLANANTTGYKASRVVFQDQFAQIMSSGAAPSASIWWYQPDPNRFGCQIGLCHPGLYPGYDAEHRTKYRSGNSRKRLFHLRERQ